MNRPIPDKHALCAIIVSYFPDARFVEYLHGIQEQCDRILIIDNGSTGLALEMLRGLRCESVHLFENGRNAGLGTALNQGITHARALGYAWVVLFDQDSLPMADMAACFTSILTTHPQADRVALIGCRFIDRNRQSKLPRSQALGSGPPWSDKKRVITSGMLLSMDAFDDIGPFREEFFIDTIDHEFCYRARRKGWRILQTAAPLLCHSVGNYRRHRFLGLDIWRSHHSALRCYFMTRNPMILAREDHAYTKLIRGGFKALENTLLILFYEEHKAMKIRATLTGYVHGLRRRTEMPAWIRRQAGLTSEGTPES